MTRRIVVFSVSYAPEQTGTGPYVADLAEGLADKGWSVAVATGFPHYPEWRRRKARARKVLNGVHVLRYPHLVAKKQNLGGRALLESSWFLGALPGLMLPRPDIVLGIVPTLGGALLALAYARLHSIPCALLFQDLVGRAAEQAGVRGAAVVARGLAVAERFAAGQADAIFVVAEGFSRYLVANGVPSDTVHVIRNWARVSIPSVSRDEARQRLGWPVEEFIVLHSGNIGAKQGLEYVVRAASGLQRNGPADVSFVIQGDGNATPVLRQAIDAAGLSNLRLLPLASDDEFPLTLLAADALLVCQRPSMIDMSLPSKLTSYLSAGRPIVAAVAGASETADMLRSSGAAVFADPTDPASLGRTLNDLRNSPGNTSRLASAGPPFAAASFSKEASLARVDEILRGLTRDV